METRGTFRMRVLMKKLEEAGRAVPMTLGMLPGLLMMTPSCEKADPANMPPRKTLKTSQKTNSVAMRLSNALRDTCSIAHTGFPTSHTAGMLPMMLLDEPLGQNDHTHACFWLFHRPFVNRVKRIARLNKPMIPTGAAGIYARN